MNELMKRENSAMAILNKESLNAMQDFAKMAITSQLFLSTEKCSNEEKIAKAVMQLAAGAEMGIGAVESLRSMIIIRGRVSFTAGFIASRIKTSGRYNYRVVKSDDTICSIEFFEGGESIGISAFSITDARKAGLGGDNWSKYPSDMLFARAISRGARRFCPDIFKGSAYTPEELIEAQPRKMIDADFVEAEVVNDEAQIDVPVNDEPIDNEPEQAIPAPAAPKKNGYQPRKIEDDF